MLENQSVENQYEETQSVGTCPVNTVHEATACVPVTVSPFAEPGDICVENCGAPVVKCDCDKCRGTLNGKCEFTISQKLKVNIPIIFGADVVIGGTYVQSGETTSCNDGECHTCNCDDCESHQCDCNDCAR